MSRLERLPLLVLEMICEILAYCDPDRKSLFEFSLSSRNCCFAATRQRFSRITLKIQDEAKLRKDLAKLDRLYQPENRFSHVRIVKLTGCMSFPLENSPNNATGYMPYEAIHGSYIRHFRKFDPEDETYFDPCRSPSEDVAFNIAEPRLTRDQKVSLEEAWVPFVQYMSKFTGLTDLVHACSDQISSTVLSTLHEKFPQSRLHMHTFSLRSFVRALRDHRPIDPEDIAIATSPCLYSLAVRYSPWTAVGQYEGFVYGSYRHNYNEEVVQRMIAGLAPRLTHVRFVRLVSQYQLSTPWTGFFSEPRDRPDSFFPQSLKAAQTGRGRLQTLVMPGIFPTSPSASSISSLSAWTDCTAWENLQSLNLTTVGNPDMLVTLSGMGTRGELASLRKLTMACPIETGHKKQDIEGMDAAVGALLRSLHPLEALNLRGGVAKEAYDAVLTHHGKSLRALIFLPRQRPYAKYYHGIFVLSLPRLQDLARQCTQLTRLCILVERDAGSKGEVSIYRALGKLTRLRHLYLALNCARTDHNISREAFKTSRTLTQQGNQDRHRERCWQYRFASPEKRREIDAEEAEAEKRLHEMKVSAFRSALVNQAIDESLARAIFSVISEANPNRSLRCLKIYPVTGSHPNSTSVFAGDTSAGHALRRVGRRWIVRSDADGHNVSVRDADPRDTEMARQALENAQQASPNKGFCMDSWTSLWPKKNDAWWDDWSSFPLDLGRDKKVVLNDFVTTDFLKALY